MSIALIRFLVAASVLLSLQAGAKIIVVNSANNVSPGAGETNLVQAIHSLKDGDTIQFNLPGTGPFYLVTPPLPGGYPPITNHNVTIDGYSQPGAAPNSNPILSWNNAKLQIVLDSRTGGGHTEEIPGYALSESSTLFIKGVTNVTVRGLCFVGPGTGSGDDSNPYQYAISFAADASYGQVQGCWIGLDVDGTNVYRFHSGVTSFRSSLFANDLTVGVAKTAANPAAAREQFNVIVGEFIPIILEGKNHRISGNFLNVFPDGVTDYNSNLLLFHDIDAMIEIGRSGENLVIGTDGDGNNDSDERNIFGGVTQAFDEQIIEFYGGTRSNIVIAGNFIGMGVDGTTRFTNSMRVVGGLSRVATIRIGSDFDGVSDELEGNVIAMNFPFDDLFPSPDGFSLPTFVEASPGTRISLRGNRLIGNNLLPYSYADGAGDRLVSFTNFFTPFLTGKIIPVLSADSTPARLKGSSAVGVAPYTNVFIDLYLADEEGWTNGQKFQFSELMQTNGLGYDGFAQGKTYLGTFVENGPQDLDPAPGAFEFDVASLNLDFSFVTVSANYSPNAFGTHNEIAQTTPFATPITLQEPLKINIARIGNNVMLSWSTNFGAFTIQSAGTLAPPAWADLTPQPPVSQIDDVFVTSLSAAGSENFFRLKR